MTEGSFTDKNRENVIAVWRKIQGDPALVDGLLFGELDDFLVGVINLMADTGLVRFLPVGLMKRIMSQPDWIETMNIGKEIVSLPAFRDALDELAGVER